MPRVTAKGPNQIECSVELDSARALLLGRAPDPQSAGRTGTGQERPFEAIALAAPSVSANHVMVWAEGEVVCARDLGSRNGTWLQLPSDRTVRVSNTDIVLSLAQSTESADNQDEPSVPTWSSRRDFAQALAGALDVWFHRQGIDARIVVSARTAEDNVAPTRVPLSTGEGLDIAPLATASAGWSQLLQRVWRWVSKMNRRYDAEEAARSEGLILASNAIRSTYREVVDAAQSGARTLLLTGPTGAGKEWLAESFHRHSGCSGPFIPVNCSMFSRELLRQELFGSSAHAFTDGKQRILGAVERAEGGTLFLDEFGEIGIDLQPMLLRFLDRREFQSVGKYGQTRRADVRVVAATNRDLRTAVRTGDFRLDLWYRMSVNVVEVPSLRSRWDDVTAYLDSRSLLESLSVQALEFLRTYPWEGNFRELTTFAERLRKNARGGAIDAETCKRELQRSSVRISNVPPPEEPATTSANWSELTARAVNAFVEDRGHTPATWDEQKEWNEKYLKPLLFFHMSGVSSPEVPLDDGALSALASQLAPRMQADRGTAAKQLARYFERYRSST